MNDNNTDNAAMSDSNTDNTGDGNMDNTATGETSTVHVLCLHVMVEKPNIQAKLKPPQSEHLLLQNL